MHVCNIKILCKHFTISDFVVVVVQSLSHVWLFETPFVGSQVLQQARLLCPSLSPWVCSNSYPLSQLCHPTISSSVAPFSSCPQFFPASGSFSMSQFFTWGGQSIRASASASVFPMNIQDWSLCSPRDSQESPPTSQFKSINSSVLSFLYSPTLTSVHDHWKNHSFD